MTTNYSLYSIPAYITLALFPHAYSVALIKRNNNGKWDNASPRSTKWSNTVAKSVPPACYAKYERVRAAHNNLVENASMMIGAVLVGNLMRLDAAYMNRMTAIFLALRVGYTVSYITIETRKWSFLRTACYIASMSCLYLVYFRAAGVLAASGMP